MIGRAIGRVLDAGAGLVRATLPGAAIGDGVEIRAGATIVRGSVRAVSSGSATIFPAGPMDGITAGDSVSIAPAALTLPLGLGVLGRAFDGAGTPLDGGPATAARASRVDVAAPLPDEREPVTSAFWTGVKTIDGLLPFGRGARIGLFGAAGAGKTTLLSALTRGAYADAVVVGLIGERGREAAEWIARRDARMTIVCAPSDRSAAERIAAARVAAAQAHVLRTRGLNVLFILDSLARYGSAVREIAIACGEPAGRGGFPASVFAHMARLVETAGCTRAGSVTMIATVLSEGPDEADPLSEAARSLLDGHVVLSATLARAGRYPAVDVLASTSRTMRQVCTPEHLAAARTVRRALASLARSEDARALGIPMADELVLRAQAAEPQIESFLRQGELSIKPAATLAELMTLADILEERSWTSQAI